MDECRVALYGCGTVGMGVAQALLERGPLVERLGERIVLRYVVDVRLDEVRDALRPPPQVVLTSDLDQPLDDPDVDVVVELLGGLSVAKQVTERALRRGKDVVTANKALLAEHGDALYALARQHGRAIAFEGSVAGAIPVVAAVRNAFIGDRIESIYGIVNGTCNYVLTRMLEEGIPYAEALDEAREQGYAEADPTLDVEGHDSAHKLAVLARLAFGVNVRLDDIPCEGIAGVDLYDLQNARAMGYTLKLLAIGVRRDDRLELRVNPTLLRRDHPMAAVGGVYNAVCIHGSRAGEVVLTGRGAGRHPTASAVVGDIARVALGTYGVEYAGLSQFGSVSDADLVPPGEVTMRFYFRLACRDQPGVLARVAGILGEEGISIASVRQQEATQEDARFVPVLFMTHRARSAAMDCAMARINQLDVVCGDKTRVLRVEDI